MNRSFSCTHSDTQLFNCLIPMRLNQLIAKGQFHHRTWLAIRAPSRSHTLARPFLGQKTVCFLREPAGTGPFPSIRIVLHMGEVLPRRIFATQPDLVSLETPQDHTSSKEPRPISKSPAWVAFGCGFPRASVRLGGQAAGSLDLGLPHLWGH